LSEAVLSESMLDLLAPYGSLRVAINLGNTVLAQQDPSGNLRGISMALARKLGNHIGRRVDPVTYPSAGKVVDATDRDEWDIAFLAVDPGRSERLAFSVPYAAIEATFVVRDTSLFGTVRDLDRPDIKICVTENAAYDLILTRQLREAKIVRAKTPAAALAMFSDGDYDAAAGVRQPLQQFTEVHPGYRVLADHFALIEQAIALSAQKGVVIGYINEFLRKHLSCGFVRRELDANGQTSVVVPGTPG
jgi:polar amino acid transport system substrate-binding protein